MLWILDEKRFAIVVLQGRTRQYKNDTGFVNRDKIKHRTGGLAEQRIGSIKVRQNVVIIHWDQHGMRILLDGTLVYGVVPMRGIFTTPAILMQLNNQVVGCRLRENALADDVDTGRLVGWRKQDGGFRGIEAKPVQNRRTVGKSWPEERVEFG